MINLVRKSKPDEDKLTQSLIRILQMSQLKNVKHIWYDLHGETSGDRFHRLNDLMVEIGNVQNKFGCFIKERFGEQKVI